MINEFLKMSKANIGTARKRIRRLQGMQEEWDKRLETII